MDARLRRQLSRARSLRTNVTLMALAMLALPQLIVVGWSLMERDIGGRLLFDVRVSADEAQHARGADEIAAIARAHNTRVRVVGPDDVVLWEFDSDRGTDVVHQAGTLFFGPDGAPSLRELDASLGPLSQRPEVLRVTGWPGEVKPKEPELEAAGHTYPFGHEPASDEGAAAPVASAFRQPAPDALVLEAVDSGCRTSRAAKLLVCHATEALELDGQKYVIYTQESSRRAVRVLYDLRYHLTRLSLVMLPFALVFAWWMGRRMVRPIEWLRARVLEKAKDGSMRGDIDLRGGEEVEDLAEAFNGLLRALGERRQMNEAFIADLVHEFKNPVAAIRSCAESLAIGSADAQRAARIARILTDSSARLDMLVSQFLELARAEAGLPREDRTPVDLAALATGVTGAAQAAHPGVAFVVEAEALVVPGVAARLDSVLRNLVDNAASFAGDGGTVTVRVQHDEGTARVEVGDTGPGISEEDLPRVFDRFFTTRALVRRGGSSAGTGLGLALVKAIVEAHGGTVTADSAVGAGATFRLSLPMQ